MPRRMLTDELWSKLVGILRHHRIYNKPFLRDMVEGMLYRMRVGCPWRDLPNEFGFWNTIYQKFNRWSANNKLMMTFKMLVNNPDLEWEFIDGSIVKAHQHSSGAANSTEQGIGKSVAGNTTKIHMVADSYGLPIDFKITGGEVHDCKNALEFISKLPYSDYFIADKGYDNEILREKIRERTTVPVIPRKRNSLIGNADIEWDLYKHRHLIENLFARIKHIRAIATRYDKLKRNYESMLALACS